MASVSQTSVPPDGDVTATTPSPPGDFSACWNAAWDQSSTLFILLNVEGDILHCNPAARQLLNISATASAPLSVCRCHLAEADPHLRERVRAGVATAAAGVATTFDIAASHFVDDQPPLRILIEPLCGDDGEPMLLLMHADDISEHVNKRHELERLAHYDTLTCLPNRALVGDYLRLALARARRENLLTAVCYLDLDGFKAVNDQLGHAAGDSLLVEVAGRLSESVRGGDTVARLGGDEFVLIIGDIADAAELDVAMSRVLTAVAKPYAVGTAAAEVSASIGVALFPEDGDDADSLLRHADQAMYLAKQAGRNRYHRFDQREEEASGSHRDMMLRLLGALDNGEFELYYLPKVSMRTGKVVGVEALLRWFHPTRGLLSPGNFLDVLEKSDLAVEVGRWVLGAALRQAESWHAQNLGLVVAINVSPHHLEHPGFVADLSTALDGVPSLPRALIELEISESDALKDIERIGELMKACERLGVGFAMDNFGMGSTSVGNVSRLPARTLKIDRSFVAEMLNSPEDLAIIDGIIGLSSAFRRQVVAEGIECAEHGTMLLQLGCDIAQGYGIAPPMSAERLPAWVRAFTPDPSWSAATSVTWAREDLPLLKIAIDHRNWMQRMQGALATPAATQEARRTLGSQEAVLGSWFKGVGKARFGGLHEFREVGVAHARVLESARNLFAGGEEIAAEFRDARARALKKNSDAFLASLSAMQRMVVSPIGSLQAVAG